jgi:chemotaxis protein MotA
MDFATIIGLIAGATVVVVAILIGGSFGSFVDLPSILIVVAGGFSATLIRFPLTGIARALVTGAKVSFTDKVVQPREVILEITRMSELARKSGAIALESIEVSQPNLAKGAQYIADSYDAAFIRDSMELARDQYLTRLSEGQRVFKSLGDAAPAFGMIGTLVGLVQMLSNMDDPSKIGPAMAVALLTTLYGAVLANVVCLPIADKLNAKLDLEEIIQTLIIDGILAVRAGTSPSVIRERLIAYLPEHQHKPFTEAA